MVYKWKKMKNIKKVATIIIIIMSYAHAHAHTHCYKIYCAVSIEQMSLNFASMRRFDIFIRQI